MLDVDYKHGIADDKPPSEAIIRVVAKREGMDKTEVDALTESVDPDALNKIVNEDGAHVEFDYEGYTVIVSEEEVWLIK